MHVLLHIMLEMCALKLSLLLIATPTTVMEVKLGGKQSFIIVVGNYVGPANLQRKTVLCRSARFCPQPGACPCLRLCVLFLAWRKLKM